MKVPSYVRGAIAPTFTAFDAQGRIDADGQRNLLDFMLSQGGVSAFFVRSGMGQFYTFSEDDARQMADIACGHLAGKAPVLVGCSGVWDRVLENRPDPEVYLQQSIALGQYAKDAGADGAVYTLPEALVPANDETHAEMTLRFFEAVAPRVDLPIFIYQPPGTQREYLMDASLIAKLADIDNVVGAKASYSDGAYVYSLIRAVEGKDFQYIVGNEFTFALGLYAGAAACIGQGCTLNPHVINAVQTRFESGDRAGALDAQDAVNALCELISNPQDFYKRYANDHGFAVPMQYRALQSGYGTDPEPIADAAYVRIKAAFEEINAPFAPA